MQRFHLKPLAILMLTALVIFGFVLMRPETQRAEAQSDAESEAYASLILAGGCFWCIEADFEKVTGVVEVTSGYSGGTLANPTYAQVTAGGTGHYEVVKVVYDPGQVSFDQLLTVFWHSTDPTDAGGQFCDRAPSYAPAVFVEGDQERARAAASKQALIDRGFDILAPILERAPFYLAEEYHQDYAKKNPIRYRFYRASCGRDAAVRRLWGDEAYKGL